MYCKKTKTIQSKVEQSLRDLLLKPMFISINGRMEKTSNKHEHRWAPMNTHEHPWPPMNLNVFRCVFIDFSKAMQFANYMSSLCFQNGWFIILGVWSWMFLSQSILLKQLEKSWYVCFLSCAGLAPRKNYPLRLLQHIFIYRYKYIDL